MSSFRVGVYPSLVLALAVCGCDRLAVSPKAAESAPPEYEMSAPPPDLRPFVGETYAAFSAQPEMARYAPTGLQLNGADQARFEAAMAASAAPAWTASGGGAEALVFAGCNAAGCDAGHGLIAIDMETGAAFVGVRDGDGVEALAPNPRLEALLRLSSPTRAWEDLPSAPPEPVVAPH
jgi:hypothetical protein